MPRGPRLDAPGAVHHVMVRGVDRRDIFKDDRDARDLLRRLSDVLPESGCSCYAWVLMSNHYHLVVRTGEVPVGRVMARVGTGYAMYFNQRHGRVGHLVQNRFKSRLVRDDNDLLNLIRYVHLNPVTAGIVDSLASLRRYPWSGHAALMGDSPATVPSFDQGARSLRQRPDQSAERAESLHAGGRRPGVRLQRRDSAESSPTSNPRGLPYSWHRSGGPDPGSQRSRDFKSPHRDRLSRSSRTGAVQDLHRRGARRLRFGRQPPCATRRWCSEWS